MSLYRAETRRLTKRRFTRWLLLGSLLVLTAVAIGTALSNQQVGPDQVAGAKAQAEANYQENLQFAEQERQRCETDPSTYGGDCTQLYTPTREDFQSGIVPRSSRSCSTNATGSRSQGPTARRPSRQ